MTAWLLRSGSQCLVTPGVNQLLQRFKSIQIENLVSTVSTCLLKFQTINFSSSIELNLCESIYVYYPLIISNIDQLRVFQMTVVNQKHFKSNQVSLSSDISFEIDMLFISKPVILISNVETAVKIISFFWEIPGMFLEHKFGFRHKHFLCMSKFSPKWDANFIAQYN